MRKIKYGLESANRSTGLVGLVVGGRRVKVDILEVKLIVGMVLLPK